jgi:hypothetical protein
MQRYHPSSRTKSQGFHPIISLKNFNKDRQQHLENFNKDNQISKSQFIGFRRFQRTQVSSLFSSNESFDVRLMLDIFVGFKAWIQNV